MAAQTCKAKETGEDGILREKRAFSTSFGGFSLEASCEALLNFSGGQSVQQSARLHGLLPFAARGSGHAEGTKRFEKIQPFQLQVGPLNRLSLSMDLQPLGPFLSRVLLGFTGVYFGAPTSAASKGWSLEG